MSAVAPYEQLLNEFAACRRTQVDGQREKAPHFNVFRMLGVERAEVQFHSQFLADLLDPNGSHDQGPLFLSAFLKILKLREIIDVPESDLDGSGYFVTREINKIDINIYKPGVVYIGIENKIDADETTLQLKRYRDTIDRKVDYPKNALIFLTLTGRAATSANGARYCRMSYRVDILQEWLPRCLNFQVPASIKGALIQYEDTLRRMTNMQSELENDEVAVFLAQPSNLDLSFAIVTDLEKAKTLLQGRFWQRLSAKLEADLRDLALDVKLIDGWEADPSKPYVGVDVQLRGKHTLRMWLLQTTSSSQLYFAAGWPSSAVGAPPRREPNYQELAQKFGTLSEHLEKHYKDDWCAEPDLYQLGYLNTKLQLRNTDFVRRLAREMDSVVNEVAADFVDFVSICHPILNRSVPSL